MKCILSLIYYILTVTQQAEKIEKLIKAAKVDVEPFWPGLFAKALEGHSLESLIQSAGAPGAGGAAAPAAGGGGAPAAGGGDEAKEEEKKEEKKDESEESDDDMGFGEFKLSDLGSLFFNN